MKNLNRLATFHAVVLAHTKPACAPAGPTTIMKLVCNRRPGLHSRRNQIPPATIRPASPIQPPKRHLAPIEIA